MRALTAIAVLVALEVGARAEPSAEQLYNEGQEAFDHGDYATAIARWESSYALSKLPLLVLNIAQAYRLTGDCSHALAVYRQYVTLDPASEQRGLADGFIVELEPKCGSALPSRIEQNPARIDGVRTGRNIELAGIVTGGAGVAMLATGLLFGHRASSLGDEVTHDCLVSCDWGAEKSKQSDGQRDATVAKIFDGVGIAAIAVGVGIYIYGARDEQPMIAIQPGADGATLTWRARW